MENPDNQIMETKPLSEDFQELWQQSYNYDQRAHNKGEKPQSDLGREVEKFEEDLEDAKWKEDEQLEKIADMRNYRELSKMSVNDMSWEQAHRWSELQQEYPNLNIRKEQEDDANSPLPMGISGDYTDKKNLDLHRQILESLESVQDMAAEKNMDISEEIKFIKVQLKTFIDKVKSMDSEIVEKGIRVALKKYDSRKTVKHPKKSNILKKSCAGGQCTLYLDDGLKDINCPADSEITIYQNGTWERK